MKKNLNEEISRIKNMMGKIINEEYEEPNPINHKENQQKIEARIDDENKMKIEDTILRHLVHNESYTRKVIPFLKNEYFNDFSERTVFDKINNSRSKASIIASFLSS